MVHFGSLVHARPVFRRFSMPDKFLKPCKYPHCSALTTERYCPKHKLIAGREYNQLHRHPDHNKFYGRRWRAIRSIYISLLIRSAMSASSTDVMFPPMKFTTLFLPKTAVLMLILTCVRFASLVTPRQDFSVNLYCLIAGGLIYRYFPQSRTSA